MNRSRVFLALGMAVAATLGLWVGLRMHLGAQASSLPALLDLAPADSTVIVYADLATLRTSTLMQKMEAVAPPPNVDRDYADFVSATGFDFQRDLDRLVMAVGPAPAKQTVVFAEGRFDRQKIGQYALRTGKVEKHNGRDVYVVPSSAPGKTIYLTFLEGNRLAISSGGDLTSALAAGGTGSPSKLDPALDERLSRVSGAPIFAVAKAPDLTAGTSPPAANPTSPFQLLRWVSLAARPDASQVIFSIEGECDGPEQAQKVASALDFFRVLLQSMMSDPKARGQMSDAAAASASRLLKSISITNDGGRVRLLAVVTPDMIPATPAQPVTH
jgi:hypothetical protein